MSPPLRIHLLERIQLFASAILNMSGRTPRSSSTPLRSFTHTPCLRQCSRQLEMASRRNLHSSPKSFAEQEKSFRGQLYESTARRIQRQREDEARFASNIPITPFARNAAFTFCISPLLFERSAADVRQQSRSHVYWHTGLDPCDPRKSHPCLQRPCPWWIQQGKAQGIIHLQRALRLAGQTSWE